MTYKRQVNFGFAIATLLATIVCFVGLQKSPVLAISVAGFVLAWAYVNDRFVLRDQPEGAGRPGRRPTPATLSPVLDKSPALICIHEMDGRLQLVNAAAATRLGYKTEELVGKNLADIVKPIHHHELRRYLDRMDSTGIVCGRMMVTTRSGEELIWEYVNALSNGPDGHRVVFGLAMDVTDRFDSPQEAEQTESRFRQLAESIQEVF
ncbi:MAG: PAS domain-containing protein, partial [Blastocatellia bacterium]